MGFFTAIFTLLRAVLNNSIVGIVIEAVNALVVGTTIHCNVSSGILDLIDKVCMQKFEKIWMALFAPRCREYSRLLRWKEVLRVLFVITTIPLHVPLWLLFGLQFKTTVILTFCAFTGAELAVLLALVTHNTLCGKLGQVFKLLLEWTDWNPFIGLDPELYTERIAAAKNGANTSDAPSERPTTGSITLAQLYENVFPNANTAMEAEMRRRMHYEVFDDGM